MREWDNLITQMSVPPGDAIICILHADFRLLPDVLSSMLIAKQCLANDSLKKAGTKKIACPQNALVVCAETQQPKLSCVS